MISLNDFLKQYRPMWSDFILKCLALQDKHGAELALVVRQRFLYLDAMLRQMHAVMAGPLPEPKVTKPKPIEQGVSNGQKSPATSAAR